MKTFIIILSGLLFITSTLYAQVKRKDIFHLNEKAIQNEFSFLTVGTLLGVTYSLTDVTSYKVRDNIVVIDKKGNQLNRFSPSVYAFPSINLLGKPGKSLSMIVPVNLNPSTDNALGLGLTYGFNTFSKNGSDRAEVGIALTAIWSKKARLNEAQEASFINQTPLPIGETSVFEKDTALSISIGIYIAPLL